MQSVQRYSIFIRTHHIHRVREHPFCDPFYVNLPSCVHVLHGNHHTFRRNLHHRLHQRIFCSSWIRLIYEFRGVPSSNDLYWSFPSLRTYVPSRLFHLFWLHVSNRCHRDASFCGPFRLHIRPLHRKIIKKKGSKIVTLRPLQKNYKKRK